MDLFGEEAGAPTRSAVGMNVLPGNIPVETEAISKSKNRSQEYEMESVYLDESRTDEERVRNLVSQMTLEEKVSQLRYDAPAVKSGDSQL